MELKNISEKVISVGSKVVMPDHSITITEKRAATPSIKALIKQGYVTVTKKSGTAGVKKQPAETPAPAPADTPKVTDDKPNGDKPTDNPAEAETATNKRGKNK